MTVAIISLLAALVPFGIWLIKRRIRRESSPEEYNRERYREIDEDLERKDSVVATVNASNALDELERLQRSQGDSVKRPGAQD